MEKYKTAAVRQLQESFLDKLEAEAQEWFDQLLSQVGTGANGSFQDQKGNLYDSYGYGIYLDGRLQRTNARERQKTATEPSKPWSKNPNWSNYGNDLLRKTFSDGGYKPSVQKGYVVVFAATMPYTNVLQYGTKHGLSKDYHVIAFFESELENFGKKNFGKSLVKEVKDGNYQAWNNGIFIPSAYS